MKKWRHFRTVILAAITVFVASCGGGGGGGGDDRTLADEAYTGVRTQAYIDADNAEALVLGSYGYGDFGEIIPLAASLGANDVISDKISDPFRLATLVKQTATLVKQDFQIKTLALLPPDEMCINYPTGYTSDTLEQSDNDSTSTVSGDVIFNNCDIGGVIFDGTTYLSMTINLDTLLLTKFLMTMDPIQADDGTMAFALFGRISGSETSDTSIHITFEITLDDLAGHTYWLNNYTIDETQEINGLRSTMSGRFYDNDYGFVTFVTDPVDTIFIPENPSDSTYDGRLDYTGSSGSQATLWLGVNQGDYCINVFNASGVVDIGTCAL